MQVKAADKSAAKQTGQAEVLDIRGVSSPTNVLTVLKRANALEAGQELEVRSDCNPWQLYDLLQQRGFFLQMDRLPDGSFTGRVRARDLAPQKH